MACEFLLVTKNKTVFLAADRISYEEQNVAGHVVCS